ncbi:MAG: class I SAM-dependent methyltransferase [Candidatus Rokubacteria bacterium]|nr:class I SAM-dependent methyltransferase [Candidatus Rokubacteria bacterium]
MISHLLQAFLRRYAETESKAVSPFLVGRRLLDLGAGEGYVALALRDRAGCWTCSVDVGPFRRAAAPYVVYDGTRLPFGDGTFDTTLVLLTLHHCRQPEAVLDEAVRVTRHRLIVAESVYRNSRERFWLDLLDGRLNRLRHGGRMSVPLAFRPPEGWRVLFVSRGLRAVKTRWLGPWWERLVHHPLLFVRDKESTSRGGQVTALTRHPGTARTGVEPQCSS